MCIWISHRTRIFHEFAFDNKVLKTFIEFRIWWKCLKFKRRRIRIRTSSHTYLYYLVNTTTTTPINRSAIVQFGQRRYRVPPILPGSWKSLHLTAAFSRTGKILENDLGRQECRKSQHIFCSLKVFEFQSKKRWNPAHSRKLLIFNRNITLLVSCAYIPLIRC